MAYSNNHYIPQLILRRFGNRLNRYNVQTGEIKVKGSNEKAFSSKNIYPEWLELLFGEVESKFATLIDNKILKASDIVTITRTDIWLIKKFFTLATLRVPEASLFSVRHLDDVESLKKMGFKETVIEGESDIDYIYRTLRVIIESKDYDSIFVHPLVTYEACKWASMFYCCYLSIWDSTKSKENFFITDDGMNCEHDKSRFATLFINNQTYFNQRDEMIKNGYVMKKIEESKNDFRKSSLYLGMFNNMKYVHANYYLFAVSNTRTISLINPFFKLFDDPSCLDITKEVPDVWPTLLSRETMSCNTREYKEPGKINDDDLFHYKVKDLSLEEVIIINNMMLDRVCLWVGFDDSSKISKSLNVYTMIPKEHQRVDYLKLKEILYRWGNDFPVTQKYQDIVLKLTNSPFSKSEEDCILFYYSLINKKQ